MVTLYLKITPPKKPRSRRSGAPAPAPVPPEVLEDPAVKAMLDWEARGRPEKEIGYTETAPKLTEEQLAKFRPAEFKIGKRRRQS